VTNIRSVSSSGSGYPRRTRSSTRKTRKDYWSTRLSESFPTGPRLGRGRRHDNRWYFSCRISVKLRGTWFRITVNLFQIIANPLSSQAQYTQHCTIFMDLRELFSTLCNSLYINQYDNTKRIRDFFVQSYKWTQKLPIAFYYTFRLWNYKSQSVKFCRTDILKYLGI
jgi:hypothetical protein